MFEFLTLRQKYRLLNPSNKTVEKYFNAGKWEKSKELRFDIFRGACIVNNFEISCKLFDPVLTNNDEETMHMIAAANSSVEIWDKIKDSVNISEVNNIGESIEHFAAYSQHPEIIESLNFKNSDWGWEDDDGITAAAVACENSIPSVIKAMNLSKEQLQSPINVDDSDIPTWFLVAKNTEWKEILPVLSLINSKQLSSSGQDFFSYFHEINSADAEESVAIGRFCGFSEAEIVKQSCEFENLDEIVPLLNLTKEDEETLSLVFEENNIQNDLQNIV